MSYISGMEFHFDLDFNEIDIEDAEQYLKKTVSKYSDVIYNQKTEIFVHLEEGSLKAKILILGAIYIGIGQYGSFRSGIDYMIQDAKSLKHLVTSELIKNGINESDIIESKKAYCDPDKIRRVLLAIERLELKSKISQTEQQKEISKIRTSVSNICWSLSEEDAGMFVSSINQKYWPPNRDIPYLIDKYRLMAREEDIIRYSISSGDQPLVNKVLQLTALPRSR
ncbi:hypothetical protein [Thiomicrorhabdus arctica]|uniref:hypothetical protein n=1 Tax=Thiomicrorhabdus arctica TaxID=131540 RepID=UPI00039E6076|nr:hypothetical protein [Thiomicrorhabdus arctica]